MPEAEALLPQDWREPLLVQLTQENYAAFLAQYSRWNRRHLVWRLPPVIRESDLSFFPSGHRHPEAGWVLPVLWPGTGAVWPWLGEAGSRVPGSRPWESEILWRCSPPGSWGSPRSACPRATGARMPGKSW